MDSFRNRRGVVRVGVSARYIGSIAVSVATGDIREFQAGAYVIPQYNDGACQGGVAGAIAAAGGRSSIRAYNALASQNPLSYGTAVLGFPTGGKGKLHIHVASVGSGVESEFGVVRTALYNALVTAERRNISSVCVPALGTGLAGVLADDQSARALMAAVEQYASEGRRPFDVKFVVFEPAKARAFEDVLESGSYHGAVSEPGLRGHDMGDVFTVVVADMFGISEPGGPQIG